MDAITVFSATGGIGFVPSRAKFRSMVKSILWCFIFLIPASAFAMQAVSQTLAEGDSSGILPISLGKAPGCPFPDAVAMNSGEYPAELVVAGAMWCGDGTNNLPYQWHAGSWSPLDLPDDAYDGGSGRSLSVNDHPGGEPTFTYQLFNEEGGGDLYVVGPGQAPTKLDSLPDMTAGDIAVLSAQGNHVVGANRIGDWETGFTYHAVRWTRDGAGWSAPEDLAPGTAVATTEAGSIVIGNTDPFGFQYDAGPWVWEADSGSGTITSLEPEAKVNDITHDGSMIVGSRPEPCDNPEQCDFFPAPVYWVREQGAWVMHDLQALDGVDSEAAAVAIVDGSAIIVGTGYTKEGGILRPVAWIPAEDGSYGAPLRLEALGANFNSWSSANDVNREGLVLGTSELEPYFGYEIVIWSLFEPLPFQINGGIGDLWYSPATDGQGFFINVWEDLRTVFVGWFTYDTERPDPSVPAILGDPGHRWLTAQGSYADNKADLVITLTEGGVFDAGSPEPIRSPDGTMALEFSSCVAGTLTYDIPSIGRHGVVPIQRVSSAKVADCERLALPSQ